MMPSFAAKMKARRFSSPWKTEEHTEYFIVRDAAGLALAYFLYDDEADHRAVNRRLTKDEPSAAANFSKMPDALGLTDLTFGVEITMMTKEQAKDVVEAELRSLNLSKPMMTEEMTSFCQGMYRRLQFKSPNERLADIRRWADDWQAATFRNT